MDDNLLIGDARPKRADAVENCALLLRTAQQLFAEYGVEHVSMSAIADAAGVGKGTLYRHFANKVELCHGLLDEDQRALQARTFAHLREGSNPATDLRWFLGETYAFVSRNLALLNVDGASGISTLDHPAHTWWRMTIRGLLAQANPDMDVDYAADVLYVLLDPRTILFQRNTMGYDADRIVDGLFATLDRLLRP
ncbi:MAG: helix-turn-helix transcriptional regulator [Anaerolineae bacterium]|nr:helix-turn-helix transcriptional regulator [Anaerolineae bacterium]